MATPPDQELGIWKIGFKREKCANEIGRPEGRPFVPASRSLRQFVLVLDTEVGEALVEARNLTAAVEDPVLASPCRMGQLMGAGINP